MTPTQQKYKTYCQQETTIPVFLTYDWLFLAAGENTWDVVLVEKGGELFAALPYIIVKKWGFRIVYMPSLTPYLGSWIKYPEGQKEGKRLSYEKEIMNELISGLPEFSSFHQHFLPQVTNALPFHWNGFKHTIGYTYVLDDLTDLDAVFKGFQQNIRRQIRKAEKTVQVHESDNMKRLYEIKQAAYDENKAHLSITEPYVTSLYAYSVENNCGKLFEAKDPAGNTHAMMFIVWDKQCCYYLFGASRPKFKNSGAMSLLMWRSIEFAASKKLAFNFEGSMVESVERFFRNFGAKQQPYLKISKTNSMVYKWINVLRGRNN
jgi:lipid II:glycine glycyltransferase (peptidoglycan interpeptide bridge formation enzyme)